MVKLEGTSVEEYIFEELLRTEALQEDLLPWRGLDFSPRESVTKYLNILQELEKKKLHDLLLLTFTTFTQEFYQEGSYRD